MLRSKNIKKIKNQKKSWDILILGGGSNLLLTNDFSGLTIKINIKGIQIIEESEELVIVKVAAGENWHEFVNWCLENDFGGIENLALIPGSVGAAPIQNIGAYGVELESVFLECEAISIDTGEIIKFSKNDCKFSYRDSIFKNELKGKFVITYVKFSLSRAPHYINTSYRVLDDKIKGKVKTIKNIAETIIKIRSEKLPNPEKIGNAGSFFKNPVVTESKFTIIKKKYPNIPKYSYSNGKVKIPAAWIIDTLGFKGCRKGDAGVHEKHALVLVNHGNAKGHDIKQLAEKINSDVMRNFGIDLSYEINII